MACYDQAETLVEQYAVPLRLALDCAELERLRRDKADAAARVAGPLSRAGNAEKARRARRLAARYRNEARKIQENAAAHGRPRLSLRALATYLAEHPPTGVRARSRPHIYDWLREDPGSGRRKKFNHSRREWETRWGSLCCMAQIAYSDAKHAGSSGLNVRS